MEPSTIMDSEFLSPATPWLDQLAMLAYLGFAVVIAWQVFTRSK
ncbi:hypothetical protein [Spirulina major]|nr:hypothetical protein [Spirulina major]